MGSVLPTTSERVIINLCRIHLYESDVLEREYAMQARGCWGGRFQEDVCLSGSSNASHKVHFTSDNSADVNTLLDPLLVSSHGTSSYLFLNLH